MEAQVNALQAVLRRLTPAEPSLIRTKQASIAREAGELKERLKQAEVTDNWVEEVTMTE